MLKIIQQLKQQNPSAFSFALAGMVALFFALTALALLLQGLIEQKQIAKQVGDLQITGRTIEAIVSSNKSFYHDATAFSEFEKSVNSFNQQWTDFKQQHYYSDKTIKELDTVWQRINRNSQNILSMKKEIMVLREAFDQIGFKPMHKINEELVKVFLNKNIDSSQLVMALRVSDLLRFAEDEIRFIYYGNNDDGWGCEFSNCYGRQLIDILNGFLSGDPAQGIKKIEDVNIREMIKNEMVLYEKLEIQCNVIFQVTPMLFELREAHAAIYRDVPELKSALSKLNNHKLNTGLMVLTLCSWLCVFACGYGYVRALKTRYN